VADNPWAFNNAAVVAARQWKFERGESQWKSVFDFRFRLTPDANPKTDISQPSTGSHPPSNIPGTARPGEVASTPPNGPVRVGGDIKAPHKIVDVLPLYPEEARASMAKGVVLLDVTIAADGSVADTRVLRSIQLLDQAAIDAVRQWKFEPTLVNGRPVAVQMLIYINFVPPMSGPVHVGGAIRAPRKIVDVKPIYPEEARAAQVSGVVIVQVIIATDGLVSTTHVIRSIPMLDQVAIDAVRQWKFEPTLVNDVPVEVDMNVTVNFKPE
jgi:TonB family protein